MQISLESTDPAPRKAAAVPWLSRILVQPQLQGIELPRIMRGAVIYVDNVPHTLQPGGWQIDGQIMFIGGGSTLVDQMTRIAILASIAHITGAIEDPNIVKLLIERLVGAIKESALSVYSVLVKSTVRPSRIAINTEQAIVAAEMQGRWFLTSGVPVEVDASWITMEF